MSREKRFAELMAGIGELFDKEISQNLTRLYWNVLNKFTDGEVEMAFNKAVHTCKFFPRPADLIEMIQGSVDDRIATAFVQLQDACGRIGAYQSVMFRDPGLEAVVEAWGGWPEVCHLPLEEWQYRQKQFRDLYRANMDKARESKKLTGMTESGNRESGHLEDIPEPVMVGAGPREGKLLN